MDRILNPKLRVGLSKEHGQDTLIMRGKIAFLGTDESKWIPAMGRTCGHSFLIAPRALHCKFFLHSPTMLILESK